MLGGYKSGKKSPTVTGGGFLLRAGLCTNVLQVVQNVHGEFPHTTELIEVLGHIALNAVVLFVRLLEYHSGRDVSHLTHVVQVSKHHSPHKEGVAQKTSVRKANSVTVVEQSDANGVVVQKV